MCFRRLDFQIYHQISQRIQAFIQCFLFNKYSYVITETKYGHVYFNP